MCIRGPHWGCFLHGVGDTRRRFDLVSSRGRDGVGVIVAHHGLAHERGLGCHILIDVERGSLLEYNLALRGVPLD